jgi:hypothetical protein
MHIKNGGRNIPKQIMKYKPMGCTSIGRPRERFDGNARPKQAYSDSWRRKNRKTGSVPRTIREVGLITI